MASDTVALTATVADLGPDLDDWCAYHLRHFGRIILWLDHHEHLDSRLLPRHPGILALPGDQTASSSRHTNFMRRQNANADAAIKLCFEAGIPWLVHLDQDEILYGLKESLWDSDAGQITFPNHEVCPVWEASTLFHGPRYFRLSGRSDFRLYTNGKSAVRCGPDVRSLGAHCFTGFAGQTITVEHPQVLHYACATYASWLHKYRRLGTFESCWYDDPAVPITLRFHLDSRDACRSQDPHAARAFFARYVLPQSKLVKLEAEGIVMRADPFGETPAAAVERREPADGL
ncbi:MAG TPA: hypothetical protein VFO09_00500 [Methyloceanibacter sp.]|nr:hypothetical protein [Methyloceanibacter sp.]